MSTLYMSLAINETKRNVIPLMAGSQLSIFCLDFEMYFTSKWFMLIQNKNGILPFTSKIRIEVKYVLYVIASDHLNVIAYDRDSNIQNA